MFTVIGIIVFIVVAIFLPRTALVVCVAWFMGLSGTLEIIGAIALGIVAFLIDLVALSDG